MQDINSESICALTEAALSEIRVPHYQGVISEAQYDGDVRLGEAYRLCVELVAWGIRYGANHKPA